MAYFPLTRHGPNRKRRHPQLFFAAGIRLTRRCLAIIEEIKIETYRYLQALLFRLSDTGGVTQKGGLIILILCSHKEGRVIILDQTMS
jgi:hypothetical protein